MENREVIRNTAEKSVSAFFDSIEENYTGFKIFFSRTEPGYRKHRIEHHHSECELSLIISGECIWCVNNKLYQGGPGSLFIFGSDEPHYIKDIISSQTLLLLNIRFETRFIWSPGSDSFNLRYIDIFLNHEYDFSNIINAEEPVAQSVFQLMNEIYDECLRQEEEYNLVVKAKLLLILAFLGRYYKISSMPHPLMIYKSHLKQLDDAVAFINEHLTEDLNVGVIAQHVGMSKSYFSMIFKKMSGIPPWDYITRKRIDLAMLFLRDNKLSILQISEKCGFTSISNFNRCFKNITGLSPSTYRKEFPQTI